MIDQILDITNYHQNIYAIPPLVTSLSIFFVLIICFFREKASKVFLAFSLVCLFVCVWFFSFSLMYLSAEKSVALLWAKVAYLGIPFIPASVYYFTVTTLRENHKLKKTVILNWILSVIFVVLALKTDTLIANVHQYWWGYYPLYGWVGMPFIVFFISLTLMSILIFWKHRVNTSSNIQIYRVQSLLLGCSIALLSAVDFLPKYQVSIYPFGYLAIFLTVVIFAITIWNYHLDDLTPAFAAKNIINTMDEALLVLDHNNVIRIANSAADKLFQSKTHILIGNSLLTLLNDTTLSEHYEKLLKSRKAQKFELTYDFDQKTKIILNISMSMMTHRTDHHIATICTLSNITEQRLAEEELEKSQIQLIQSEKLTAMGHMAGGLAHELNSPLAGLLPMIEKYKDDAKEGSIEDRELSLMFKACKHMAKIVKDFGSFSREANEEFCELNLNEVIEDTLSFSSGMLKQNGIQLIKMYDDKLPKVEGEKTALQQVVLNMITNACDATPEGGRIIIKTGSSNHKVKMEFIDDGIGIEKEKINYIFNPFYTTKRPEKGTGLGLSISYNIIEKHYGKITVDSKPGQGTNFSIYFPAAKPKST